MHFDDDFADPPRRCAHDFGDVQFRAVDVDTVRLRGDAHDGHHTASERRGYQIGRREGFSFAVVVGRSVGQDFRSGLDMGGFGTETAQIDRFYSCHNFAFLNDSSFLR